VKRHILLILGMTLFAVPALEAGTFGRKPLAPDLGLDVLTRAVTRERLGRDLFANPYATATLTHVDVYDRFPYLESRSFQIVSDPAWNRLVIGEAGRSLGAWDGRGTALGALSEPRGLAVDEHDHVYVADTGNDRIVVLEASTEFGEVTLVPRYAIDGLSRPYDVAHSDGGTPFQGGDDHLYVAETGRNRVVAIALGPSGGRVVATLGELGSGRDRFAGPMAIAAGRAGGANTPDLYVADAHNRRIVHLRHEGGGLRWVAEAPGGADLVTSLDTDAWGNLYAAAPHPGVVRKLNATLGAVTELSGELARPRSFHVPFANVRDHRDGRVSRVGQPTAVSVEQWSQASGLKLWSLGVEVAGLSVAGDREPEARFTLTDDAAVTLEVQDPASGRTVARRAVGVLGAGAHRLPLAEDLAAAGTGDLLLRVTAASRYPDTPGAVALASFRGTGPGAGTLPAQPALLGNAPNPGVSFTRIAFVLPAGARAASLGIFDTAGRRLKNLGREFAPGLNEVTWDGTDEHGRRVRAGVYFYRLEVDGKRFTQSLVLVR
jgi:hypothetical protein